MFKKLASVALAALMVTGTAAISANAAVTEEAVAAAARTECYADEIGLQTAQLVEGIVYDVDGARLFRREDLKRQTVPPAGQDFGYLQADRLPKFD